MGDYILSKFNSFALTTEGLTAHNLPEKIKEEFFHTEGSNVLVLALPGWGQPMWCWSRMRNLVGTRGVSLLAYEFPRAIFSHDYRLTRDCFSIINTHVRDKLIELKKQYNFKRCVMVGYSLASSYGSMIYDNNPLIDEIVLVVPGNNLAEDLWHSCRVQHFRKSYEEQGFDMQKLMREWYDLASENHLPSLETKITLHVGGRDQVVLTELGLKLGETLSKNDRRVKIEFYPKFGHYGLIGRLLLFPERFLKL